MYIYNLSKWPLPLQKRLKNVFLITSGNFAKSNILYIRCITWNIRLMTPNPIASNIDLKERVRARHSITGRCWHISDTDSISSLDSYLPNYRYTVRNGLPTHGLHLYLAHRQLWKNCLYLRMLWAAFVSAADICHICLASTSFCPFLYIFNHIMS